MFDLRLVRALAPHSFRFRAWQKIIFQTCLQDVCRCTSHKSFRTLKSGVHLFAALENSLKCLVWVSQAGHQIWLGNGFPRACPSVFAWHSLIDSVWKKIRAYRQSFSAWRWAAKVIRPLHWDLKFDFECPRAVRCTWTKWHWKQSLAASDRIMSSK